MSEDMAVLFAVVLFRITEPFAEFLPVDLPLLASIVDPLLEPLAETTAAVLQYDQTEQTDCDRDEVFHVSLIAPPIMPPNKFPPIKPPAVPSLRA